MQLIPAIDLLEGGVVRLLKGDFATRTSYAREPVALAESFREAGARLLHVVDLNAARGDAGNNRNLVQQLAGVKGLRVQCGGGVRTEEDVIALLEAGASRVVIGSRAVRDPERVLAWLRIFGPEPVVLALDVRMNRDAPELLTQGWQEASGVVLWPLLERYVQNGLRHLLCTDINCDGTLLGPNVGLYREILRRYPELALQASGGIGDMNDVEELAIASIPSAIVGRALLEGRVPLTALEAVA